MMTSTPRILVVDDDCRITEIMERILKSKHYTVKIENNSVRAHLTAQSFKPNLILLDVTMPYKDGGDVAQALRFLPATAGVPIIFVTSIVSEAELDGSEGWIAGEEYIAKPVSTAILVDRVRQRLSDPEASTKTSVREQQKTFA